MKIEKRNYTENPILENRSDSNLSVNRAKRYMQINEIMSDGKPRTFRMIAQEMFYNGFTPTPELLYSQPRVTELVKMGKLEPIGKTICETTGKKVSVFKLREN